MPKVFIIHGFQGSPNGGWRPWLMAELEKQDIYACSLSMPKPIEPVCSEWVEEISRFVEINKNDDVYLVGHSLGVPAILRYLEKSDAFTIKGAILVSGPSEKNNNRKIDSFLETPFDFETIKSKCDAFTVIHGDNDPNVPLDNAKTFSRELNANLVVVENGGHLNGSSGWTQLLQCLDALNAIIES
ncbi:serine hydrolase family protein [Patescibacteria group bacterium]|nr:serine hydrolase family protein [Patescibacteria group bacterium]